MVWEYRIFTVVYYVDTFFNAVCVINRNRNHGKHLAAKISQGPLKKKQQVKTSKVDTLRRLATVSNTFLYTSVEGWLFNKWCYDNGINNATFCRVLKNYPKGVQSQPRSQSRFPSQGNGSGNEVGSEPPQIFENLRWLCTLHIIVLNFAKSCILSCWLQFNKKMRVTKLVFEL